MVSSEPASRGREVHHHHRYIRYNGEFAACRIVRSIPVVIVGGSGDHRIFSEAGILGNVLHTYRGHPMASARLRGTVGRVRTALRDTASERMADIHVNRLVVRGLGSVSRITCIHFTSICGTFSSTSSFVRRVSGLWSNVVGDVIVWVSRYFFCTFF